MAKELPSLTEEEVYPHSEVVTTYKSKPQSDAEKRGDGEIAQGPEALLDLHHPGTAVTGPPQGLDEARDGLDDHSAPSPAEISLIRSFEAAQGKSHEDTLDLLLLLITVSGREGWEEGPTESEVNSACWDYLSNFDRDPGSPKGQQRAEEIRGKWYDKTDEEEGV